MLPKFRYPALHGIKEVHDDIWLVSFMEYDLGYFDLETKVLEPLENPFGPKVLPM
jgi:putative transposase